MSVSMTKADRVTVFTLTSDLKSPYPPVCEIFKGLCYNPVCCTVSQHLRRTSQSSLGTLHIMIGSLNIGFGVIVGLSRGDFWWELFPFWLPATFMIFGITCIVSEKFPSPCLVIVNVILNLAGVGFAIAAIILYSNVVNIGDRWLSWTCSFEDYWRIPTPYPEANHRNNRCMEGEAMIQMFMRNINAMLVVLSVLELCVTISSAVLGIKALRSSEKEEDKSTDGPELHKPLLEEITTK
ncbi:transmembrane protein 176B [Lates calcarifer]|uniref:Transmembrane protein 176B n=1 Tax=Lates calcarifer TaxID=8187 RepID=A0AAJ8DU94_LATCA|nr:transmembrane protein 176B [Lates calcarifer]XP_050931736.1 transmembrane protein 176B [Lates calcarifer]